MLYILIVFKYYGFNRININLLYLFNILMFNSIHDEVFRFIEDLNINFLLDIDERKSNSEFVFGSGDFTINLGI